jgi:chemotaxis protein CheZ
MNRHRARRLQDPGAAAPRPLSPVPQLHRQLGQITRQLQEAMGLLGALPGLHRSALDLPDARSRLAAIERRSFAAADRVLNAVEQAKQERQRIAAAARDLARATPADAAGMRLRAALSEIEAAAGRIDAQLTDIMVAQDFHDLTGQMLAKVGALAIELEAKLLQLMEQARVPMPGPAPRGEDTAASQREVDDLLAKLGL